MQKKIILEHLHRDKNCLRHSMLVTVTIRTKRKTKTKDLFIVAVVVVGKLK